MDIRFLAIIFLVAALMEMLSKMMKKARQREIEDEDRPRNVDPLAQVFKEMELLPDAEEVLEPGRRELERGKGERPRGVEEMGSGPADSPGEGVDGWALPGSPVRERSAGATRVPLAPSGRAAEPTGARPRVERMFAPERPAESTVPRVPVRAVPELEAVPSRDRAPRPVEVRSREFRPREAREVVPHRRAEVRPAPVAAGAVPREPVGERAEQVRSAADAGKGGVLELGSVRGLRRLVVAREVLGPPLALRGEEPFPNRHI